MKKLFSILLVLALAASLCVVVSAEEVTEARVPVTLTVINTQKPISVTVPASLPVSVVDGMVLVADNAKIVNNANSGSVRVTNITVEDGALSVADYDDFEGEDVIALSINGSKTTGAGDLTLNEGRFPNIEPGTDLPISYHAKVQVTEAMRNATAATVIFTIAAAD